MEGWTGHRSTLTPRSRTARAVGLVVAAALLLGVAGCAAKTRAPRLQRVVPPRPLAPAKRDPRKGSSWVIVYSPHPDDETVGMGMAIRRYVLAGYNVQVVLLTDGETSRSYQDYYRRHPELWRDLDHDGVKGDLGDFGLERRREFVRATNSLGVPVWHVSFFGVADNRDGLSRDFMPLARVTGVMRSFEESHPGALHVTVAKYTDGRRRGPGDARRQAEHRAACDALLSLVRTEKVRAVFYKVYVYDLPRAERWSPRIEYDPSDLPAKRRALFGGYDDADLPAHLAIGWHSVPVLIDNVLTDPREFAVPADRLP